MTAEYRTFMDRWRLLLGYVRGEGRPWWRLLAGPVIVFVGVLIGLAGNIVNIYWLSSR